MDISTLAKNIFVYILDNIKPKLYKSILDGNNTIIDILGNPTPDTPLWFIGGGEAINYYSSSKDKTPTKDIDCKLLFTGPYNIPKVFFEKFPDTIRHLKRHIKKKYPEILGNKVFNFQSSQLATLNNDFINRIDNEWNAHVHKLGDFSNVFTAGLTSRKHILYNCMTGLGSKGGHLMYINNTSQITHINFNEINSHVRETNNEWSVVDMDTKDGAGIHPVQFKLYIVKTPYVRVGKPEDSFPYNLEDLNNGEIDSPEGEISDEKLNNLQNTLDAFYSNNNKDQIWDLYYKTVSITNLGRYLMSLNGVCILVEPNGKKWVIEEGILDLFVDFSASETKQGKYIYENKSPTGMIPNILKQINYCGKIGYIRIPTLSWLIYDQTRMLYHSLRLQEVGHHGWSDKGVANNGWHNFVDGRQSKYFSKLKGMVNTYLNVLNTVESDYKKNKDKIVKELQNCTNETDCTPSAFISYIYGIINPTSFIPPESEKVVCNPPDSDLSFESNRKIIMNNRSNTRKKRSRSHSPKNQTKSIKSPALVSKYRKIN